MWQMLVAVLLELDVLRMTTVFWWTRLVFLLPPVGSEQQWGIDMGFLRMVNLLMNV